MHSFHAFIDESGDDGFVFRDPPDRASSEWFIVGALVVRDSNKVVVSRKLHDLLEPIESARKAAVHFAKLSHEDQVGITFKLSKFPVRAVFVCVNKRWLTDNSLKGRRKLYFYCVRFLIERISWMVRDQMVRGQGDGRCRLNFSHCKGLSYESLSDYLKRLKQDETQIVWEHIDTDKFNVQAHKDSAWLRAADVVTSGVAKALELSRHGLCEDRFARTLRPIIYNRNHNYFSYGLKFFPEVPEVEKERDNRYSWLSLYKK